MNARLLKFALSALFLMSSIATVKATTYTVDNKSESAAQYTDLQAAVDAAQPGDTLLIAGSASSYGNVTIRKKLALIGQGYAGLSSKVSIINFFPLTADSDPSGSYVTGLDVGTMLFGVNYLNSSNQQSDSIVDVTLERNKIANLNFGQFSTSIRFFVKRFQIRNNLITNRIDFAPNNGGDENTYQSIQIQGNIFDGGVITSNVTTSTDVNGVEFILNAESTAGVFIRNNIWTNRGAYAFEDLVGAVVENNVLYGVNPIRAAAYTSLDSLEYSINFNNNITFLTDQDLTANSWFAVGFNNINEDPLFVDYPVDGAAFSLDHDYQLQAGSPAIGAGVNGEDLGIYGGAYPWPGPLNLQPKGPIVTEFEPVGSPSVPAGGTVEFRFKSKVNN